MNDLSKISEDFKGFTANSKVQLTSTKRYGNIIKGDAQAKEVSASVPREPQESSHANPEVIVHKDGEIITSIEFICICGQKSEVRFDYSEE
jgi:hypothetical protein